MKAVGLTGARRGKRIRTAIPDDKAALPADLVRQNFQPGRLRVADFTYIPTWAGMVFVAVVLDAYSRRIRLRGW